MGFTAESKDGDIRYYGLDIQGSSTAIIEMNEMPDAAGENPQPSGKYISWSLSAVEDAAGNYIKYEYDNDVIEGRHLLSRTYGARDYDFPPHPVLPVGRRLIP